MTGIRIWTVFAAVALCGSCRGEAQVNNTAGREHAPAVKNVILMVGDGMGVAQVSQLIVSGGLAPVNMERAGAVGLVRTFSANNRVTDSAAAGTALASGTKTNNGMLGMAPDSSALTSVMALAGAAGMGTGIVVTCVLTHATPGAFYAHAADRYDYETIAAQLLDAGVDVALGGGRNSFDRRSDGRDLVDEFKNKGYSVIFDIEELAGAGDDDRLLGLFTGSDELPYAADGRGDYLPVATGKALDLLTRRAESTGEGFFLMVEGSLIDYAGHANTTATLAAETADFDRAVGVAFDYADRHPGTLVVVLADHETGGLTLASGNPDFEESDSGVDYRFSTTGHTASLIPLFAYGAGAGRFSAVLDNTDIPKIIADLLGLE